MNFDEDDRNDPPTFGHKNPYDLNSKIMLSAIVSLSFVVVLVIILHIYARCVLRRQARRRSTVAAFRGLDLTITHTHSIEPPKTGLDPIVIASMPIYVFNHNQQSNDNHHHDTECAVCLSNLENQEMARLLPNCNHTFHVLCIDKWFESHSTCPICRTEAEPRLQPEPREAPTNNTAATAPTAPLLENVNEGNSTGIESSSSSSATAKVIGSSSSSRLSSFRRMISRERSSRRLQSCGGQEDDIAPDLERQ